MTAPRFVIALAVGIALYAVAPDRGQAASASLWPATVAQLTLPTAQPAPAVSGLTVQGRYVTAPIFLDGVAVIRIAAPLNPSPQQLPLATRVAEVQAALDSLVAERGNGPSATTIFDPRTFRIDVKRAVQVTALEATDAKHTEPVPIVTVTSADAGAHGADIDRVARRWQDLLQRAVVRSLDLRQPSTEKHSRTLIVNVAIVLIVVTLAVVVLVRVLSRRTETLQAEIDKRAVATAAETPTAPEQPASNVQRRRFLALLLRNLAPESRLRLYNAVSESLVWGLLLAWFIAATWGLSLFAQTTPLAQNITRSAIAVAATILVTGLLNRILDILIARGATAWRLRGVSGSDDRARLLLRIPTIARTLAGAKTFALVFVAVLSVAGQIGVPIGSVVTIGGLAAIALSLAAQNFVRDFLNGFLVLYEDQYVVGDYVTINTYSGTVELLTLRMVQIRDASGDLITIPHSAVVNVVNQSRNWSRVDYRVPVDPAADIPHAVDIVRGAIEALAAEGDWTHGVSAPLEWI
jgi:small-conductance mechanosensitive channel